MDLYERLYRKVQEQLKSEGKEVDLKTIEKVFRFQFDFVRKTIEDGDWYAIRLKYLGIFGVKTGRVKYTNSGEIREQVLETEIGNEFKVKTPSGKHISLRKY